jgi:hypothetical protein
MVMNPSPILDQLLAIEHPVSMDAGSPNRAAGDRLRGLNAESLFAPVAVRNADLARACLSGLWLRFDFLDESHRVSQELHNAEGSFWHAIMHRREGDFGNSKYWWRRVGEHPAFRPLGEEAHRLGLFPSPAWDPSTFVDRVEECLTHGRGDAEVLRAVQDREWGLLFEFCRRRAVGA